MSEIIVGLDGLYRDGIKLKLEFGNDEQIAALRKHERKIEQFKEGVDPDVEYEVTGKANVTCICGSAIRVETEADHEDDIRCFDGIEKTCRGCKRNYKFTIDADWRISTTTGKPYIANETLIVVLKD